jgi:hypothetical protein
MKKSAVNLSEIAEKDWSKLSRAERRAYVKHVYKAAKSNEPSLDWKQAWDQVNQSMAAL